MNDTGLLIGRRPSVFPPWLRKGLKGSPGRVSQLLKELRLKTVCQEALCPNIVECFGRNRVTFLILGDTCTRRCGFCNVKKGPLQMVDEEEPWRLLEAVKSLGLRHVVITSVTRDDLPDGGSQHYARVIVALKGHEGLKVEVLTPDFQGRRGCIKRVLEPGPDLFAHNIETVPRLYKGVRPGASYPRSLGVLEFVKRQCKNMAVKSGLMLGLGEGPDEVVAVLKDLRSSGCDVVTLGQYLRPSIGLLAVERFIEPQEFEEYRQTALALGFSRVEAGPFVRSSYYAGI